MASVQADDPRALSLERDLAGLVDGLDREIETDEPLRAVCALFLAVLECPSGGLRYVNAGAQRQIVLRRDGPSRCPRPAPPGLYPGGGFEQREIEARGGDALFLFTDGLVETRGRVGRALRK